MSQHKRHVRLGEAEKRRIILQSAKQNLAKYGEYAIQPTKLSESVGVSKPVLGLYLADTLNPLLKRTGKREIGILSRKLVNNDSIGSLTDDEARELLAEFPDVESDDILPESEDSESDVDVDSEVTA